MTFKIIKLKCTIIIYKRTLMNTITATNIKKSLWNSLSKVDTTPLVITKRNKNHAVLISYKQYSHYKKLEEYEDILFWLAAKEAMKEWLGTEQETKELLDNI